MLHEARHADDVSPIPARDTAVRTRPSPTVEMALTANGAQRPGALRLSLAWLLFGACGLTSLLASVTAPAHAAGGPATTVGVLAYVLTIGALAWAALELRRANDR